MAAEKCPKCGCKTMFRDKVYGVRCTNVACGRGTVRVPDFRVPKPKGEDRSRKRGFARGGKRQGAGRPPVEEPAEVSSSRLPPALLEQVDRYALDHRMSRSATIAHLVELGLAWEADE